MKKILILTLACIMVIGATACKKEASKEEPVPQETTEETTIETPEPAVTTSDGWIRTDISDNKGTLEALLGVQGIRKIESLKTSEDAVQTYTEMEFDTAENAQKAFEAYKSQFTSQENIVDTQESDSAVVILKGYDAANSAMCAVATNDNKLIVVEEFGVAANPDAGVTVSGADSVSDENKAEIRKNLEELGYALP